MSVLPNPGYCFCYSLVPPNYVSMRFYVLLSSYGTKGSICLSLLLCQILDISSAIHQFLPIIYPWDFMHSWVVMALRALSVCHCFANYLWMRSYAFLSSYSTKSYICLSLLYCQILDISSAIRQFLPIIDPWDSMHSWVAIAPRALSVCHCFPTKSWISLLIFASSSQLLIYALLGSAMVPKTPSVWHCFTAKSWISLPLFTSSSQLLIHAILCTPE